VDSALSQIFAQHRELRRELSTVRAEYKAFLDAQKARPMSVADQINTMKGRRIPYMLNGTAEFTIDDLSRRGTAINFLVSQDGPFIWTHYPLVAWRPSGPANATNLGRWRPVASWPLPTQQLTTDFVDISYEMQDSGTQRAYQNLPNGTGPLSRPDNIVPLPEWSVVAPNSVLTFTPIYEAINFGGATATDTGLLHVSFIGFRVVNA